MDRASERKLIRRAARGDRQAAGQCIKAFQGQLYAYILRLSGSPDMAEDIVQEAFIRVLTNLDKYDERYRFSTWLFTIARRLYLNAAQKRKPLYQSEMIGTQQSFASDSPDEPIIASETQQCARSSLDRALAQLPDNQREIVVLFHQFDWPIALIAQHLQIPQGTVKSHLHRGRKRLRDALEIDQRASHQVHAMLESPTRDDEGEATP